MVYTITIQDEAGKPIPGAAVSFLRGSVVLVTMTSGAGGVISFDSDADSELLGADITVRATIPGYSETGASGNALLPDSTFIMQKTPPYGKYLLVGAGSALALGWVFAGGKKRKIGGFFDSMTGGQKLALVAGGGLAAYLLFFASPGKSNTDLGQSATGDLATLHNQGVDPTISNTEASTYAGELVAAFDGCGTDEQAVYNVFQNMKNKADVVLLIAVFDVRSYGGCFDGPIYKDNVDYNLGQAMSSELSDSELAHVNDILAGNGIDYKF